ncbi:Hypothetical protein GLP15_4074 [Giardia lamblia P15]|uniref:Uncharacterized protein n=1 Tax=Giardia intestinalis (strain P15) TaxID=658858 RepID=E1F3B0_GIAIA|nr:Hypothetical protein GLP15_4074 [Giardia lamblia P15]
MVDDIKLSKAVCEQLQDLNRDYYNTLSRKRDECCNMVVTFLRDHMSEVHNAADKESLLNSLNNLCTSLRADVFCIPGATGIPSNQLQTQLDVKIAEFCSYHRHSSGRIMPLKVLHNYLNKDRPSAHAIELKDIVASLKRLRELSSDYELLPNRIGSDEKKYISLGDSNMGENSLRILSFLFDTDAPMPFTTVENLKELSQWTKEQCEQELEYMKSKGQLLVDTQADGPTRYYLNLPLSV